MQRDTQERKRVCQFPELTLRAQLMSGRETVKIFGEPCAVKAGAASIDAFSGHADKHELKRYVGQIGGNIKKIAVIHGEEPQATAFAATLRTMKPNAEVIVPDYGQIIEY